MRVSQPQVKRVMLPMPTRQWVNGREEIMILLATRSSIRKMEASCCCCCSSSSFQPPAIQSSPGRLPPTHGLIFFRPRALKMFRKPGSNVDQVVTAPPRCTEMCKKKKKKKKKTKAHLWPGSWSRTARGRKRPPVFDCGDEKCCQP